MSTTEPYIVSARKYRPSTFQSVVGQRALTATLKNAILGGKLAQAYLFCGPRGVGKTSCARIFAKTINCQNPTTDGEACGSCESCKAIERGSSFNLVELDAASNNSVDDIRSITEQVNIPAQDGRYRVFIIDEVHMLSNNAFNAFLKTLEEPPKNVVFILATTERHKVIPTILSRCQIYDFKRITVHDIIDHLEYVAKREGVNADREALGIIALKADGAMRDALSIFDQVAASTQGNVTYSATLGALNVLDQSYYFRLVELFRSGNVADALLIFKEVTEKGFDAQYFVNGLAEHIRNLMVSADPRTVVLLETSEEWSRKYREQSPGLPVDWYYKAMKILNDVDYQYRTSGNKRLLVELALIRLSRLSGINQYPPSPTNTPAKDNSVPFQKPERPQPQTVPEQTNGVKPIKNEVEKTDVKLESVVRVRRPADNKRPQSFRLTDNSTGTMGVETDKIRDHRFTSEELSAAWTDYADAHPDQRILVSSMRNNTPQKLTDREYVVKVAHPAQRQAFEGVMPELMAYLREKLDNDSFTLKVEIKENEEESRHKNPKEILKSALDENPELAKFLKSIDAELI